MTMVAWHNDPALKARAIRALERAHEEGRLQPYGFSRADGGACAVGCLVQDQRGPIAEGEEYDWSLSMGQDFGIPDNVVSRLIYWFDHVPQRVRDRLAVRFVEAIPVGADLSGVQFHGALYIAHQPMRGAVMALQTLRKAPVPKVKPPTSIVFDNFRPVVTPVERREMVLA